MFEGEFNVSEVLRWLVGGGAFIVVNWAISWGFERADFWHGLDGKLKSIIILVLSILVGVGAQFLILNPDAWKAAEPYALSVILSISAWLVTQKAHVEDPDRRL